MPDPKGTNGPAGLPLESLNYRHTGARKLEARPGEPLHTTSWFDGNSSDERDSVSHLMNPVMKNETHQYDGVNPPGSFGIEADPKADAVEGDAAEASTRQAKRPL